MQYAIVCSLSPVGLSVKRDDPRVPEVAGLILLTRMSHHILICNFRKEKMCNRCTIICRLFQVTFADVA